MIKSRAQWQAEHQVACALARQEFERLKKAHSELPSPKWVHQGQMVLAIINAINHWGAIAFQTYDMYRRQKTTAAIHLRREITSPDPIDRALKSALSEHIKIINTESKIS